MLNKRKICLNLGGGAARSYAHIGVIRALSEQKINFDMIVGVSAGALAGASYALNPNVDELEKTMIGFATSEETQSTVIKQFTEIIEESYVKSLLEKISNMYTKGHIIKRILLTKGILTTEEFEKMIAHSIPDVSFDNTKIPFACPAVDMYSAKKVIFQSGSLRNAVIASGALPMVCPPKIIGGVPYIDGGVLDKIGIETSLDLGFKNIIAIDVSNEIVSQSSIQSSIDVLIRAEEIASMFRTKKQLKHACVIIKPVTEHIHWADYKQYKALIQAGYDATISRIDEIRHKLKITSPFKRIFPFLK